MNRGRVSPDRIYSESKVKLTVVYIANGNIFNWRGKYIPSNIVQKQSQIINKIIIIIKSVILIS